MLQALTDLWTRSGAARWLEFLPAPLREPPVVYVLGAALLVGLTWGGRWLWRLWRGHGEDDYRRDLKRDVRQLRREGDFLGLGQVYEELGDEKAALEAYRRGDHHAERVDLLVRRGERSRAKTEAREAEAWEIYADLCRDDEEHEEAGAAFERAGRLYDAARSYQAADKDLEAARCYTAIGMGYNAAQLLIDKEGRAVALALESAVRSSLKEAKGTSMSPDMAAAVRRTAQLWLAESDAERAYRLAADAEQWAVAAPIARDYLAPASELIDVCLKAGDRLAAAEIAAELGEERRAALYRAEHHERRGDAAEAARWYESAESWNEAAEHWAAAGETGRAAELFERSADFETAARLYAELGDKEKEHEMLPASRGPNPFEAESDATHQVHATPEDDPTSEDSATFADRRAAPTLRGDAPSVADERYVLEEELGRGGMGVVFRAFDLILRRPVAYKKLSGDVTGAVEDPAALLEEARAAARLSHPNIVHVYDAGALAEGGFFVVMELVEGQSFAELLKKRKLSVQGVIVVARQICSALAHAHERRIVHRDLKPSNLIWTPQKQVKLADFGLARAFEDAVGKVMTRPAGTPYYMSPEQIRGGAVDPRTDLYALGCVVYEMLCQRTPFSGGSSIYHHLNSSPEDPRQTRREIPESLGEIVLRCLEKDPDKRPASALVVERALAKLAG